MMKKLYPPKALHLVGKMPSAHDDLLSIGHEGREGAKDEQSGLSGGERSPSRKRWRGGKRQFRNLLDCPGGGGCIFQIENSPKVVWDRQTAGGDGGRGPRHPPSYDMCDHLCFLPWRLNPTLLLPAQISLVIRPPTLPLSDLSNHPGERGESQPSLPAVHPTHPLRAPPPAQGVDFWKCTSAAYTPVYRKPTLQ